MHPHALWVCRHGETVWNREGRWQGREDSPLTAAGEAQARRVGAFLVTQGIGPATHRILTSPQGRAAHTAALALADLGGKAEPDLRLSEIDVGAWTGLDRDAIRAQIDPGAGLLAPYAVAPGAETFDTLMARVRSLLLDLGGPALLFTHGITSRFLRAAALGGDTTMAEALPGGQGVVHRIENGQHDTFDAATGEAKPWPG